MQQKGSRDRFEVEIEFKYQKQAFRIYGAEGLHITEMLQYVKFA